MTGVRRQRKEYGRQGIDHVRQSIEDRETRNRDMRRETRNRGQILWTADGRHGTETLDRRQRTGDKEKRRKTGDIGRETRQRCKTGYIGR